MLTIMTSEEQETTYLIQISHVSAEEGLEAAINTARAGFWEFKLAKMLGRKQEWNSTDLGWIRLTQWRGKMYMVAFIPLEECIYE